MIRFSALALVVAMTSVTPAISRDRDAPPTREVSYADLDLTRPEGVRALDRRLETAATRVCGVPNDRDLAAKRAFRDCRVAALAAARPRVELAIAEAARRSNVAIAMRRVP